MMATDIALLERLMSYTKTVKSHVLTYQTMNASWVWRAVGNRKGSILYSQHAVTKRQHWKTQPIQKTTKSLQINSRH